MEPILVIGAANIDYIAYLDKDLILKDSNIGKIKISYGGVGRNIVENLARLGAKVTFFTAIGEDSGSIGMKNELLDLNVELKTPKSELNSSSYIALINKDHDMEIAVSDTRITELINPAFLQSHHELINSFNYICLDANVSEELIAYIFSTYKDKKIIVDTISTGKARKFQNYLKDIYLIKTNIYEARAILEESGSAHELITLFKKSTTAKVFITQGLEDIVYLYNNKIYESPVIAQKNIVNATGAGDAFVAGLTYQILNGESNHQKIVDFAKKVSNYTLLAEEAVNKNIKELVER